MFQRISKAEAKKRFTAGKSLYLCPCKMRIGGPWNIGCLILNGPDDYISHSGISSWDIMYNSWAYYNTSHEAGYYAHYYVEG